MVLAVPILTPKNASPPRHLTPLPHTLSPAIILPHALAGGLVLVAEMVVLRIVPTITELRFSGALFFFSCFDALLDGARGLAAVVPRRSAALGVGRKGGREEGEGEEEVTDRHELGGVGTSWLEILLPVLGTG